MLSSKTESLFTVMSTFNLRYYCKFSLCFEFCKCNITIIEAYYMLTCANDQYP
jgi:hypothetical protein